MCEKSLNEDEIRIRADILILNSEFPTHRKTEAMEEIIEIFDKQIAELDKKDKEIEELKQDNAKQWEERCRLTFKLQETEERLSQIELQLLEED